MRQATVLGGHFTSSHGPLLGGLHTSRLREGVATGHHLQVAEQLLVAPRFNL